MFLHAILVELARVDRGGFVLLRKTSIQPTGRSAWSTTAA
jgi:hypothetical protein